VPLASGFLSGKYTEGAQFPKNDVRSNRDQEQIRRTIAQVQRIRDEEVPPDVPMSQWALAWTLQHPAVTCVIPGCKSVQQVEENARAADLEMVSDSHPQAAKG
jgi:aryl-alcohol dehydrogenase-like predicted oxidoreductase